MTTKKVAVKPYKISLEIRKQKYKSSGKTLMEALDKLDIGNAKGMGILIVSHNGEEKSRILSPLQVERMFSRHGLVKEIIIKQLALLFENV